MGSAYTSSVGSRRRKRVDELARIASAIPSAGLTSFTSSPSRELAVTRCSVLRRGVVLRRLVFRTSSIWTILQGFQTDEWAACGDERGARQRPSVILARSPSHSERLRSADSRSTQHRSSLSRSDDRARPDFPLLPG